MKRRFLRPKWEPKATKLHPTSISETKMGAQGDQAAPKAPKFKPNDAQSLPKVAQRPPKIPKGLQNDPQMLPKMLQKCEKSNNKINWDWQRFWKRYFDRTSSIFSRICKPKHSNNLVKTVVFEGFSIFAFFFRV